MPRDGDDSPPTSSRPSRHTSRNPSITSVGRAHQHAPVEPSRLRESTIPSGSPEARMGNAGSSRHDDEPDVHGDGIRPSLPHLASAQTDGSAGHEAQGDFRSPFHATARTRLLDHDNWDAASGCGSDNCKHGAYSPRARSPQRDYVSYGSIGGANGPEWPDEGFGGRLPGVQEDSVHSMFGDTVADGLLGGRGSRMSTTRWLAERHGVKQSRTMYVSPLIDPDVCRYYGADIATLCRYLAYYIPFLNWIKQYKFSYLKGDLVAALTVASFYIPMSLSYADNLGHVPPINGIYSFVFNPLIYAFLGSCPMMVVGPEAAGSLLTGQVVRANIESGKIHDKDGYLAAEVAGIVTFMAGAVIFLSGMFRLGFLDNVLSRPFLRGFISAIGIVIFIDQLIPELGLDSLAKHTGGVAHGSCVEKAIFIVENIRRAHGPTAAVSFGAFGIIMFCRCDTTSSSPF